MSIEVGTFLLMGDIQLFSELTLGSFFKDYTWLVLKGQYEVLGINYRSTMYKTSTLPTVLSLQPVEISLVLSIAATS